MMVSGEKLAWWMVLALGVGGLLIYGVNVSEEMFSPSAQTQSPSTGAQDRPDLSVSARSDHSYAPLFGTPSDPAAPVDELEDSTIALKGLVSDRQGGFAVIEKDGTAMIYGPGDEIGGIGRVEQIGNGAVIITGSRGRVALRFEQSDLGVTATPAHHKALSRVRFARIRLDDGSIGLRVTSVADTPEGRALGLRRGDVITALNDKPVRHPKAIEALAQAGGPVEISYLRRGAAMSLKLKGQTP